MAKNGAPALVTDKGRFPACVVATLAHDPDRVARARWNMMTRFGIAALVIVALPLPAIASPEPVPQPVKLLPVPPIAYTVRTLANGATLYALRDPSVATVSVNIWYGVGQRDDPRGRGGFAHLNEHLMFKQTRNLPQGVMPYLVGIGCIFYSATMVFY